jgi:hypothetical protein
MERSWQDREYAFLMAEAAGVVLAKLFDEEQGKIPVFGRLVQAQGLAQAVKAEREQPQLPGLHRLVDGRAVLGAGGQVELGDQEPGRQFVGDVAGSIPTVEVLDLQQADPLPAGFDGQLAEQDTGVSQQVVKEDPAGLAAAVGGGYVGLVGLGTGILEQPVAGRARLAAALAAEEGIYRGRRGRRRGGGRGNGRHRRRERARWQHRWRPTSCQQPADQEQADPGFAHSIFLFSCG